jgi:hypothetical protein
MSIEDDLMGMLAIAKRQQASIDKASETLTSQVAALSVALNNVRSVPANALEPLKTAVETSAAAGVTSGLATGQKELSEALGKAEGRIAKINGQGIWPVLIAAIVGTMIGGTLIGGILLYQVDHERLRPKVTLNGEEVAQHIEQFLHTPKGKK